MSFAPTMSNRHSNENLHCRTHLACRRFENVFRADEVKSSLERELALSNASLKEDGYFKVLEG